MLMWKFFLHSAILMKYIFNFMASQLTKTNFCCFICTDDGSYALKKVLIQNNEQLELVKEEIRVSSLFSHPNLLPLLDHAIIATKVIVKAYELIKLTFLMREAEKNCFQDVQWTSLFSPSFM